MVIAPPTSDYTFGRSSKETSARHRGTAGCLMKISLDRLLSVQFHMPRLPDVLALLEARIIPVEVPRVPRFGFFQLDPSGYPLVN